jgi:hypothetical protein
MRGSRRNLGAPMPLRITGTCTDSGLHYQLGLWVQLHELPNSGRGILPWLNKCARHDSRARRRQLGEVMFVRVPADQTQGIQNLRDLCSPLEPGEKLSNPLAVVPSGSQQCKIKRSPVNAGVIPFGHFHLASRFLQGPVEERLIFIEAAGRTGCNESNSRKSQSRVPEPRFINMTAITNITTTAADMSANAAPTSTSEVPRNP